MALKSKSQKQSPEIGATTHAPASDFDEAGYRRMVELSPMPIAVHDKGILVFVNKAAGDLIGAKDPDELIGRNVMEFIHPDSQPIVLQRMAAIYTAGKQQTEIIEEKFIRLDGEIIYVEIASLVFNYQGNRAIQVILRDVTERQRSREALRESEEHFRRLADSMPQMVWISTADGAVTYRNKRWYDFTGFTQEPTSSHTWSDLIHPDDRAATLASWRAALKGSKEYQTEFRIRPVNKPKGYHWFLARAVPVKDAAGKVTNWFGTSTDIENVRRTALRKKELEKINSALTEQQRQLMILNQAKDEFISLASHQLRTPATGVKQFLGMALEGYAGELNPEQRLFLERAYDSNERQITIVNDLLQVAQVDAGKVSLSREDTDLVGLIRNVISEQSSRFEQRKQTMRFEPAFASLCVQADASRLRMVIENLIDNASKYTPEGKSLAVQLSETPGTVLIAVIDQGVGIAEEDMDKIFLKFARLDNVLSMHVGGSGLGLYWAQKIIQLHNGSISVTSELDKGSTFTIMLPKR